VQDDNGLWRTEFTERGHLEIEFAPCGAAPCGTILRVRDPEGTIGPYEYVGRQIVWDMMPAGTQGGWTDGKIWDPRNGRTFNSRMALENGNLVVTGCVLGNCQSQTWRPVP
jgi:uncharacterized protein (DUF2147 family)